MARLIHKLTDKAIQAYAKKNRDNPTTKPRMVADGGSLYLRLTTDGGASWIFRYSASGRGRQMGCGAVGSCTLAEVRERAAAARKLLSEGKDPLDERGAAKAAQAQAASVTRADAARADSSNTFAAYATRWVDKQAAGWKDRHQGSEHQWRASLATYAYPIIGSMPLAAIEIADIRRVLDPIWLTKTETASRVRGRIEKILDAAGAEEPPLRDANKRNPAQWRGILEHHFPKPEKVKKVEAHAAMPYAEVPALVRDLRAAEGVAVRALELIVLTACRRDEVCGARWSEVQLDAVDKDGKASPLWVIPGERMKVGQEHRVPLTARMVAIFREMAEVRTGDYVFPAIQKLTNQLDGYNVRMALLRHMPAGANYTVHGMRSAFRDWVAECTNTPSEIAEMALAHQVGSAVERSYRRTDLLDKRRALAEAWGVFCDELPSAKVLPMKKRKAARG